MGGQRASWPRPHPLSGSQHLLPERPQRLWRAVCRQRCQRRRRDRRGESRGPPLPLIVKLAPDVPDIARIAHAVVVAGADAICAINTMPGMIIDVESGQPVLQNRRGGISGPALLPIALRCVYEIHQALPDTPIIGVGGVTTGVDAIAMLMAGATLVGVGSAVYYRGPEAVAVIRDEMATWLDQHGYDSPAAVHALAHRQPTYDLTPTPAPIPA